MRLWMQPTSIGHGWYQDFNNHNEANVGRGTTGVRAMMDNAIPIPA